MTTAKTTFNRATEENLKEYNDLVAHLNHLQGVSGADQWTRNYIRVVAVRLEHLKPYLFPETNKVNY